MLARSTRWLARATPYVCTLLVAACPGAGAPPSPQAPPPPALSGDRGPARAVPTQPPATPPAAVVAQAIPESGETAAETVEHVGVTFVIQAVGSGGRADARLPLLIGLHGLGDTPEAFVGLLAELVPRARVAAARGLSPYSSGWAWLPPNRPRDIDERARPVRLAAQRLEPAIAELAASRPTCGRPLVIGFSQGAMVAYGLAASAQPALGAVYPVAGYLPPSLAPGRAPSGAPPIVALHGTVDGVVKLGDDRASVDRLRAAGYSIELREYAGEDHTISPAMRADLRALLMAALREMACDGSQ